MGSDTVETNDGGIAVTTRDDSCSNTSPTSGSNKRLKVQKKEKKKQMSKTEDVKEDMSWICAECKEAECGLVLHNNKKQKYDEGNSIPVGEGGTAVDDDDSSNDFLICDGPCHRIFHLPCAGLTKAPPADDDWFCQDCIKKEHACAYCSEYGKDYVNVYPCQHDQCGLFFHETCLRFHQVEYTFSGDPSPDNTLKDSTSMENEKVGDDNDDDYERDENSRIPIFTCNAHHCWTCSQEDMIQLEKDERTIAEQNRRNGFNKKKTSRKKRKKTQSIFDPKGGRLYRCLYCPIAYHATCIPPSARFHELAVLCHEHSMTHKLPELDIDNSLQKQVENKVEKALLRLHGCNRSRSKKGGNASAWYGKRGLSTNPFFPGLRGDRFDSKEQSLVSYIKDKTTLEQNHNQKNVQIERAAFVVKPSSTLSMVLDGNLPFVLPIDIKNEVYSKPPSYTHIHSNRISDPNNRPKKIPFARGDDQEKCTCTGTSCGENCFNRITMAECFDANCNLGNLDCGNRALSKRRFVKCQPKRERGKGWGLVTLENVPQNKLVQEYMGEVINEKEKENRLSSWNCDHNFYVMALSRGFYVDAREYANYSRFINHSCAPNCKVVSINVKGNLRNGIYSIRDIQAGELLSYDYHFDTKQEDRFICRCGAPNCRGTMKGARGGGKGDKESNKAATWKEIRARYENDKTFLAKLEGTDVVTLKHGLLPGTDDHTETIVRGPMEKHRQIAIQSRLFLWRNVKLGANFVSRSNRLKSK